MNTQRSRLNSHPAPATDDPLQAADFLLAEMVTYVKSAHPSSVLGMNPEGFTSLDRAIFHVAYRGEATRRALKAAVRHLVRTGLIIRSPQRGGGVRLAAHLVT